MRMKNAADKKIKNSGVPLKNCDNAPGQHIHIGFGSGYHMTRRSTCYRDLDCNPTYYTELSALIASSRPRTVAPPISFHRPVSWGARRVETREQKKFNYSRNGDDVCAEVGRTRSTPIYLRSPMPDARIVFLKSLPIPDNPNYQHPLQNPNLKAAIALYESGDLESSLLVGK